MRSANAAERPEYNETGLKIEMTKVLSEAEQLPCLCYVSIWDNLKQSPQKLVVDIVVVLYLRRLDEGA